MNAVHLGPSLIVAVRRELDADRADRESAQQRLRREAGVAGEQLQPGS